MRITSPFPRSEGRAPDQPRAGFRLPRWLIPLLVLALAIGGLDLWQTRTLAAIPQPTTAAVTQADVPLTVQGSGSALPARSVDLSFQTGGQVATVPVQLGQTVQPGQPLATLDARDLQLALQQAQATLLQAQAKLDATQHGAATPQDLASAQAAVQAAQAGLTRAQTGNITPADVTSAQATLQDALAKLDALEHPSAAALQAAQDKLSQAQTTLQTTQSGDSASKTNALDALQQATDALTKAQSAYATAQGNWSYVQSTGHDPANPTTTNAQGKKVSVGISAIGRQQYYDAYVQAVASLHAAETAVNQAQVAADDARQKEAADVPQAQAALQDAQAQLTALQHPTADDLTQARAAVTQAQAGLQKLVQGGTPADIASAQAGVTQAQAGLQKLTAPGAPTDLTTAAAGVAQAQASLAAAQLALSRATLTAPYAGQVAAVAVVPGSIVGASTTAVTLIDRSSMHVDLNLSETDAATVAPGQPVQLTFDALPTVQLAGTVQLVAPASTVTQNVVTYLVRVSFTPGTQAIKAGMTANATILVQTLKQAVLVPSRAVQAQGRSQVVQVLPAGRM